MTWVSVVDSAVKIGLGALIAGFFAFLAANFTHSREVEKEYTKKRRDFLEKAIDGLSKFHKGYTLLRARFHDHLLRRLRGAADSKEDIEEFTEAYRIYGEGASTLVDVEGYILSIGEEKLHQTMMDYADFTSSVYDKFYIGSDEVTTEEQIREINNSMRAKRKALLLEVAEAYRCKSS